MRARVVFEERSSDWEDTEGKDAFCHVITILDRSQDFQNPSNTLDPPPESFFLRYLDV